MKTRFRLLAADQYHRRKLGKLNICFLIDLVTEDQYCMMQWLEYRLGKK